MFQIYFLSLHLLLSIFLVHYLDIFFQDRQLTSIWESDKRAIVNQIRLKWNQVQFSEEEIVRVEGILDVNTLELVDHDSEHSQVTAPRGFYPITSFARYIVCTISIFREK